MQVPIVTPIVSESTPNRPTAAITGAGTVTPMLGGVAPTNTYI